MKRIYSQLPYFFVFYPVFLLPTLFIVLIFWYIAIDGVLYYCSDKTPLLDFIPPFVHGSQTGDYFIAPSILVNIIWIALVALIILLPVVLVRLIIRERKFASAR